MEDKKKVCDGGCVERHSEEWTLSKELAKSNKRMFAIIIVLIALWFSTIVGFVWYINQYEYVNETITVDTQSGGDAYYSEQSGDGVINYGKDTSEKAEEN